MKSGRAVVLGALALTVSASVSAQWLDRPTPGIPRTKDGKPNLSAPVPRARNGKPDLSGVWRPALDPDVKGTNGELLPRYFVSITGHVKADDAPFLPEAAALFKERLTDTTFRQIFTDGRPLPDDPMPSWMGSSVARWEGDTLVVDTIGLNDKSWLDRIGHTHSDALHIVERFRRRDFGHMDIQVTIDDPKMYTKPITFTQPQALLPDTDLLEYFCTDNEVDTAHFK